MKHVSDFARVVEVCVTSDVAKYERLCEDGWVELGVMLIPAMLANLIPEVLPIYAGFVIALGRLQGEPRVPTTEETFLEPIPSRINAKLAEGWTLVGIGTATTGAFARTHGRTFISSFIVQR